MSGTDSYTRNEILIGTFLVVILAMCSALIFYVVSFYLEETFAVLVVLIATLSVITTAWIAYDAHIHRKALVHLSALCHGKKEEGGLCPRCKGFYLGLFVFGVLCLVKSDSFIIVLNYVGLVAYATLLSFMLLLVQVHIALRRLKKIDADFLLGITGFMFPLVIYMVGSLITALLHV